MKTKFFYIFLVFCMAFIVSCSIEESFWKKAKTQGTIEAYEEYLKKYPQGKHSEEARQEIFCLIAKTSSQERNQEEINEYYQQLEKYAPDEIKPYVKILKDGWNRVEFPAEEVFAGEIKTIERPREVSDAAKKVSEYVQKKCNTQATGVYLGFPKRVIRVVVEQTYEEAKGVSLPFFDDAKRILETYGGYKVVDVQAKEYDATLYIKAKGTPLGATYVGQLSGWHWSGAKIEGSLKLVVREKTLHKRSFSHKESPPFTIITSYSTPESAPFRVAFDKSFPAFPDGLLGLLYDLKGLEPLISALKDEEWLVREAAARALEKINPKWMETGEAKRKVPEFISALKDNDPDVRETAAYALGELKDPRAVEPFISALKDENSNVRRAAADALKSITGKDFGTDYEKWSKWWEENKERFRKKE